MMYLPANLKKYRMQKELTQEEVAEYLGITAQSVSKWERGESYPDITLLPALANIFETSVDLLLGMDTIRAEETRLNIHRKAIGYQRSGDLDMAEKTYREALLIYPNKPGMENERQNRKRDYAKELIENGTLKGFVAIHEGKIVGFCNADLKDNYFRLSLENAPNSWIGAAEGDKILSIVCFTVQPDMRRKGIAKAMLDCACNCAGNKCSWRSIKAL